MYLSTLVGASVYVDKMYLVCHIMFVGFKTLTKLVILDMDQFDIILRIDWLSPYNAILDYYEKIVIVAMPNMDKL